MRLHTSFLHALSVALAFGALAAPRAIGQESADALADFVVNQALHGDAGQEADAVAQAALLADADADANCEQCQFNAASLGLSGSGDRCAGRFYAGADYLSVRATFSESTAFIANTTDPITGDETTVFGELGFGYDESYRIFGGYRVPECGGQIEFGFTNFNSSGIATSPVSEAPSATDPFTTVAGALAELPALPGQSLVTTGSVDAQAFDLGFSKTIPLGSPPECGGCGDCCDSCDSCCNSCCGCWCPAWDLTWSGGLRYADVDWRTETTTAGLVTTLDPTVTTGLDFNGFGLRFGMQGRRYVGRNHALSFFLKGDISLLLGDINLFVLQDEAVLPDSLVTFQTTQIVPVTDIVAGATAQVTRNFTVSGGYLLSAWHDLGMRATTVTDPATAAIPELSFDDANILGFDGFFLRGEYSF